MIEEDAEIQESKRSSVVEPQQINVEMAQVEARNIDRIKTVEGEINDTEQSSNKPGPLRSIFRESNVVHRNRDSTSVAKQPLNIIKAITFLKKRNRPINIDSTTQ